MHLLLRGKYVLTSATEPRSNERQLKVRMSVYASLIWIGRSATADQKVIRMPP